MNTDEYKQRLLAEERKLLKRIGQEADDVSAPRVESVRDVGEESVEDEQTDEQIGEAQADRLVLTQVREALKRIASGTFGKCVVDGRPVESERLRAVPWTPYCLKHEQELEGSQAQQEPTL